MKKILILGTKAKKRRFYAEVKKQMPQNIVFDNAYFEDIIIFIDHKNISIKINQKDIQEYDLVYFRKAGVKFMWMAAIIAQYLSGKGKKFIDSTYKEVGPFANKFYPLIKLASAGYPVIPTLIMNRESIAKNKRLLVSTLGLPMVMKDSRLQKGAGVFLIEKTSDIDKFVGGSDREYMFQKFIEKADEFRILVLGTTVGCYERKIAGAGEFRNNVSLGAREEFLDETKTPKVLKDLAVSAAKLLKIEIAGVDILTDKKGKHYLIEVNRGPGLTYDSPESPEIKNIAAFLERAVK